MANIRVKSRLDNMLTEILMVKKHISMYSGVSKKDAAYVKRVAEDIAQAAVDIANQAERPND